MTEHLERLREAMLADGHGLACPILSGLGDSCQCRTPARFDRQIASQAENFGIVEKLTAKLHYHRLIHSCMTCIFFDESAELCIPVQQRPPARVIAFGCKAWRDDSDKLILWAQERMAHVGGTLQENLQVVVSLEFAEGLDPLPF